MSLPVAPYKVLWLGREYSLDPHDAYMLCSCAGKTIMLPFAVLSPAFTAFRCGSAECRRPQDHYNRGAVRHCLGPHFCHWCHRGVGSVGCDDACCGMLWVPGTQAELDRGDAYAAQHISLGTG